MADIPSGQEFCKGSMMHRFNIGDIIIDKSGNLNGDKKYIVFDNVMLSGELVEGESIVFMYRLIDIDNGNIVPRLQSFVDRTFELEA